VVVHRDYERSEQSDFVLNVEPLLSAYVWATPIFVDSTLVGWQIQPAYE
jgi:hypothetical protein